MPLSARLCLSAGILALVAVVLNQLTAGSVEPALQRSSALAALLAVGLMLIGSLWNRVVPQAPERATLEGSEGLLLRQQLPQELSTELQWGSQQLLKASPAAVVLVWWRGEILLQRGLSADGHGQTRFEPGAICQQTQLKNKAIHLVDLRHYPGRAEFDGLLPGLPSVVIQPIGADGLLLLGGWSARCFSRSDLSWIEGWANRLTDEWLGSSGRLANAWREDESETAPVNLDC